MGEGGCTNMEEVGCTLALKKSHTGSIYSSLPCRQRREDVGVLLKARE